MNYIESILNFIFDKKRRISAKAAIIILSITSLLLIDNLLGFTYFYSHNRQLDQLESIYTIRKDSTLSEISKQKLLELENELWNRKNIFEKAAIVFSSKTGYIQKVETPKTTEIKGYGRNDFWFLVSTSGVYMLVTIIMIPVLLFMDKKSSFLKSLATFIIFALVMGFTSWFNYWLFGKIIPDNLWGSWTWNYVINAFIQVGLMIGLYWATKNINNVTENNK